MEEKGKKGIEGKTQEEILQEILETVHKNEKEIRRIRRYMRRTLISKLVYWGIIITITAGAVYAARPYVQKGIETYNSVKSTMEKTSQVIDEPASLFKDVKILQKLFELKEK